MAILSIFFDIHVMAQNNTTNDMIKMQPTQKKYNLRIGQKASLNVQIHGSVGLDSECQNSDANTLKLVSRDITFKSAEQATMPGGDEGNRTYIFEALEKGKTTIRIDRMFRGKVEGSQIYEIVIN